MMIYDMESMPCCKLELWPFVSVMKYTLEQTIRCRKKLSSIQQGNWVCKMKCKMKALGHWEKNYMILLLDNVLAHKAKFAKVFRYKGIQWSLSRRNVCWNNKGKLHEKLGDTRANKLTKDPSLSCGSHPLQHCDPPCPLWRVATLLIVLQALPALQPTLQASAGLREGLQSLPQKTRCGFIKSTGSGLWGLQKAFLRLTPDWKRLR